MNARRLPGAHAAYLLHRWDWSETSLILDLFTRDHGRIVVAARGAKRPYSQLRSALLPFQRLSAQLARGTAEAEVQTLRGAEFAGGTPMPSGAALMRGFYLNELLLGLIARGDPHARLFDAYAATLPRLAAEAAVVDAAMRAFEVVLLREIGVLPSLDLVTATQQAVAADRRYRLVPEAGMVDAGPSSTADTAPAGADWTRLQASLASDDMHRIQSACAAMSPALKTLLRHLLHYHLGMPAMKTRVVMRDIQRLLGTVEPLAPVSRA